MSSAKDEILASLKMAENKRGEVEFQEPDFTSTVYLPLNSNLAIEFQNKLELVGGKVFLSESIEESIALFSQMVTENKWQNIYCKDPLLQKYITDKILFTSDDQSFDSMKVGITRCEFLIAHLGSVMVSSGQPSGRRLNVFPEIHIIFASENQLIDYLETGLEKIKEKYGEKLPSIISVITGPSRTADIEKTLVKGMHGPKSLIVFLCKKPFK